MKWHSSPVRGWQTSHKDLFCQGPQLTHRIRATLTSGLRYVLQVFVGDKINAGIYCLSPAVLDRIEMRPTSIEKETFPLICRDGKLFAYTLPGYWMDVGQPKDYLTGAQPCSHCAQSNTRPCMRLLHCSMHLHHWHDAALQGCKCYRFCCSSNASIPPASAPYLPLHMWLAGLQLHLTSLRRTAPETLASGPEIEGNVIVHPSAKIGKDCKIGPNVSIGIGCEIDNGIRIANSVLLHRVKVRCLSLSDRSMFA